MTLKQILNYLACPGCHCENMIFKSNSIICPECSATYKIVEGIPILLNSNNLDSQEQNQMEWFNKHYHKFSDQPVLENWRLSMLKRIFEHNFVHKIKTYLDIGCGATGYTAISAAQHKLIGFGLDISLEAMLKAKYIADNMNLGDQTAFIVASAQNLPFKKNIFDYVSAVSVLEHLDNDQQTVSEINRVTKKYSFICVPNTYFRMWLFLWPFYYYNDLKIGHKRHYSIENLKQLFKQNKFKLVQTIYNGHLIKFIQIFLYKFGLIKNKLWWQIEIKDINENPYGVQLNAIFQKKK